MLSISLPHWRYWYRRGTRCLATVIGESGFKARVGRNIVSGYSGVCFEIKFLGRYIIGFDVINNNGILRAMHTRRVVKIRG